MDIITSAAYYRQRVVRRSYKIGVTKASIYYHVSRKTIYEWRKRYDGNVKSLKEKIHRPKHHPKEHTEEEKRDDTAEISAIQRGQDKVMGFSEEGRIYTYLLQHAEGDTKVGGAGD